MSKIKVDQIESVDGVADITLNNDLASLTVTGTSTLTGNVTASGDVTMSSMNGGQLGGRRNLIINGGMVIDQRNSGSTVTAHNSYPVDRFRISEVTTTGTFEASRSTDAPDDFTNSLFFKVKTTDTSIGAEYAGIRTKVEGYDIARLNFGTSAAKTITLSFYVKFSVAGTYGGAIGNGSNRTYPFSYTVNTADTWERKTITIEGSTSGTFASDNAMGFELWLLSIGGTNYGNEAAGAWLDSYEISPTGVTNFYATDESTYYITGVQLEVGDTATEFEHRSYGEELALCQRYYQLIAGGVGQPSSSSTIETSFTRSEMRAGPTASVTAAVIFEDPSVTTYTQSSGAVNIFGANARTEKIGFPNFSGLTTGKSYFMRYGGGLLALDAEL